MRILALDLGKYKSVACDYEAETGRHGQPQTFDRFARRRTEKHSTREITTRPVLR